MTNIQYLTLPTPGRDGHTHRMAFTEWGEVNNPDVVICVHGLTRNGRDFDDLAKALAVRHRVFCVDIVGRGESDWLEHGEDYGYPLYVADMLGFMVQLRLSRVKWVGTSMGGLIGMMLAATQPEMITRMVLNDVGPFLPKAALERIATYVGQQVEFADREEAEATLRENMQPFGISDEAQWQHIFAHSIEEKPNGLVTLTYDPAIGDAFREKDGSLKALDDVDIWPMWEPLALPVLVLRGEQSDVLTADTALQMAEKDKVQLITYPGIGHAPALMEDGQVRDVVGFLK